MTEICESCGLPAAPHNVTDCFKELIRKRKIADEMFHAAIKVIHHLEEPVTMKDKKLGQLVVNLDVVTWRYAM